MSKPKVSEVSEDGNTISIERGDEIFVIKVTCEGIIIDVYGDGGNEWIDSPFAAMWDEMLPEETGNNDE